MKPFSILLIILIIALVSGCQQSTVESVKTASGVSKQASDKDAPAKQNDKKQPAHTEDMITIFVGNDNADGLVKKEAKRPESASHENAEILALFNDPAISSPEGTELLDIRIKNGLATVDLNKAFESGGGTSSVNMRVAEIVFTLTERPDVDSVKFIIEGQAVEYITGEGYMVKNPFTRRNFDGNLKVP